MGKKYNFKCAGTVQQDQPSRFEVVLLQEGLGNFGNCFYYTRDALKSAIPLFEGEQAMLNHLTMTDEQERPEGDVEKLGGYYQNLRVAEVDGRSELRGIIVVPKGDQFDKARDLLQAAIDYAKDFTEKDFIGLSINASGDAEEKSIQEVLKSAPPVCKPKLQEAIEKGIEVVKLTSQITDVLSCDIVTKAGAGGKVLKLLESYKPINERTNKMANDNKSKKKEADPADAGGRVHADADKDKALIKSMLDKHVGKDKHDDSDAEACKQAAEAYKEMGHEGESAFDAGAKHVAAEKKMKQKKEAEKKEDESGGEGKKEAEDKETENEKKEDEGKKESVIKLAAENSKLKERMEKLELELHVDKKLSESGLSRKATKIFRENTKGIRSVREFDSALGLFVKARESMGGETYQDNDKDDSAIGVSGHGISFADCVED